MARPRSVTDSRILEVAREVFLKNGPSVSTQVVADALGVSQATLFKRFGTKGALMIAALIPKDFHEVRGMLDDGPDDRPIQEQLLEIATRMHGFFTTLVPSAAVLACSGIHPMNHMQGEQHPAVLMHQSLTSWFERAMDRGLIRPGHPRALATMLAGALKARPFIHHVSEGAIHFGPLDTYVDELVQVLLHGVMPTSNEASP